MKNKHLLVSGTMTTIVLLLLFVQKVNAGYCTGSGVAKADSYGCTQGGEPYGSFCCTKGEWYCTNNYIEKSCSSIATYSECVSQGSTESNECSGPKTIPITCIGCSWVDSTPSPAPPPSCSCTDWVPKASCGDQSVCSTSCSATQRCYTRTCSPTGCDSESGCFEASECSATPIPTPCPAVLAPTGLATDAIACGDTSITYSWNAVSGASSYKLRLDREPYQGTFNCSNLGTGDQCINNITGTGRAVTVIPGANYKWWAIATNACGSDSNPSSPQYHFIENRGWVQGRKVMMPGNLDGEPARSQTVTVDSGLPTTAQPYSFPSLAPGNHTVAVTTPAPSPGYDPGYSIGYTLCTNTASCHNDPPASGTSAIAPVPSCGYNDLYFHFTPQGDIEARASLISRTATTCDQVTASTDYLDGTVFSLSPAVDPPGQTQIGGDFVRWNNILADLSYTITGTPTSVDYSLKLPCYTLRSNGLTSAGPAATLSPGDLITWRLGFAPAGPWTQIRGGDAYAASSITSLIPNATTTRQFVRDATGGNYPGVAIYGAGPYDFDIGPGKGESLVSSRNWLVQTPLPSRDFFASLYRRLGSPATPNITNPDSMTEPVTSGTYYTNTDVTTSGDWTLEADKKVVLLVDGTVTVEGKLSISGEGFLAIIAKGGISIDSSVGGPASSSTPTLEGVFVTNGTFDSGTGAAGTEKLVVHGSVIAGDFLLQRDLGEDNLTTPSEYFLFNPMLLFTMPDELKDVPYTWGEVNP